MANTSLVETRSNLPTQNTRARVNVDFRAGAARCRWQSEFSRRFMSSPCQAPSSGCCSGLLAAQAPKIARQWERAVVSAISVVMSGCEDRAFSGSFRLSTTGTDLGGPARDHRPVLLPKKR